ncbi:hypothetical protein [Falsirhodobacter sp. 20TX0035]|uniref:hypothetical protein n=1 Tax=Falsirhodobacter sp. 20TX0035 TaxID=3022019 RepID=UPI002330A77B|nr:hypothetical protein [Falsirhodobacter sp. 20TX0035]MDB6455119.1 hypothetical protein [Falsirhodobacter sp. 20TX0035]
MKPVHFSINLSQCLYNALRADYINHPVVMKPEGMARSLPDIAAVPQDPTPKVIHHGE